jgi:hypothetical protein
MNNHQDDPDNEAFIAAAMCAVVASIASAFVFCLLANDERFFAIMIAAIASCLWVMCWAYATSFASRS